MARRFVLGLFIPLILAGCAGHRSATESPVPAWSLAAEPARVSNGDAASAENVSDEYQPIPDNAAAILGCTNAPESSVCAVAPPNAEEDSAFRAEAVRLASHPEGRCRRLGEAILTNETAVRMYRKALVQSRGSVRLYGVGHAYEIDDVWLVRVARRLDDLNERTLGEKLRTLRHEMSHTIGATETRGSGWTAEDYASNCG